MPSLRRMETFGSEPTVRGVWETLRIARAGLRRGVGRPATAPGSGLPCGSGDRGQRPVGLPVRVGESADSGRPTVRGRETLRKRGGETAGAHSRPAHGAAVGIFGTSFPTIPQRRGSGWRRGDSARRTLRLPAAGDLSLGDRWGRAGHLFQHRKRLVLGE